MMNCYHTFLGFFYPDLRVGEVEIAHWMVMVTDEIFPRSLLLDGAAADMTKITCVHRYNDNAFFDPDRGGFKSSNPTTSAYFDVLRGN